VKKLILYAKVARLQAIFLSVLPIVCFYLYGTRNGGDLNLKAFSFVAISIVLFHLSANTISEFRDFKKGVDDPESEWPRYRIVSGIVDPKHILKIGMTSFIFAAFSGIMAVLSASLALIIPGLIGAFLALFYSEWPIGYKYKGLGECGVLIAYGPLTGVSCTLALTNTFCINDILFSMPIGILTASVLLANNIRDYKFDIKSTKTITTIFGQKTSYILLFTMIHIAFFLVLIMVYTDTLPKSGFMLFATYPIIFMSIKLVGKPRFVDVFGVLHSSYCIVLSIILSFR
jgi:1,4-dihydroxy-2-naphthoate octaprenyltransferase